MSMLGLFNLIHLFKGLANVLEETILDFEPGEDPSFELFLALGHPIKGDPINVDVDMVIVQASGKHLPQGPRPVDASTFVVVYGGDVVQVMDIRIPQAQHGCDKALGTRKEKMV